MLNAKITGIASYLPDDVLDNEMLSQMVDTNDEWITTRVGVKERRILKKPVGSSWMGIQAVNKLLEETGTDRNGRFLGWNVALRNLHDADFAQRVVSRADNPEAFVPAMTMSLCMDHPLFTFLPGVSGAAAPRR